MQNSSKILHQDQPNPSTGAVQLSRHWHFGEEVQCNAVFN